MNSERKIIGILDKGFPSSSLGESNLGLIHCLYEIFDDSQIFPINKNKMFCETGRVFIKGGYSEIYDKFKNTVFLCNCNELHSPKPEDSRYSTTSNKVSHIQPTQVVEILNIELPDVNFPSFSYAIKPSTKLVILLNEGFLYGPFEYDIKFADNIEYTLTLKTREKTPPGLPRYFIAKTEYKDLQENLITIDKDGHKREYLVNLDEFVEFNYEKIDYISDSQIINKIGFDILKNSDLGRILTKNNLLLIDSAARKMSDYSNNKSRYERLSEKLKSAIDWEASRESVISNFLEKTDFGKNEIENYIKNNELSFFKNLKEDKFREIEDEISRRTQRIDSLKEEIKFLHEEKKQATTLGKNEAIENNNLNEYTKKQRKEIIDLDDKIKVKNKNLDAILIKYKKYNNLNLLEEKINRLKDEEEFLEKSKQRTQDAVNEVNDKLNSRTSKLLNKMIEVKTILDASNIQSNEPIRNKVSFSNKFDTIKMDNINRDKIKKQEEYILNINKYLLSTGRNIEYSELVNIIVSIAQSQFTLFSGLPGTGKTSLAKLLSQAMGLNNRFLNIPVSKGWTSPRDIFGFYNTLSQTFQASPSELYNMLSDIQNEDPNSNSPIIILLDEFNLSQPEHYFSSFLEMSDSESDRIIKTGDPKQPSLYIPKYMKFLCTINNDDSVQSLTPRMIDRSAIIHFSRPSDDDIWASLSNKNTPNKNVQPISANDFMTLFTSENLTPDANIAKLLLKISSALSDDSVSLGNNIILSYRKYISITNYCNVASPLLTDTSEHAAFDIAFSQHIYPLLNGFGKEFEKRLKNIKDILHPDMRRSRKNLDSLINSGKANLYNYKVIS